MLREALVTKRDNGIWDLQEFAIAEIKTVINNSTKYSRGTYTEQASSYMIRLHGEKRWRRVYYTQIGNPTVTYIKVKYYPHIYCERAVEAALQNV